MYKSITSWKIRGFQLSILMDVAKTPIVKTDKALNSFVFIYYLRLEFHHLFLPRISHDVFELMQFCSTDWWC